MKKLFSILFFTLFLISCSGNKPSAIVQEVTQDRDEPQIILSLGDSLTAGYGLAPEESYPSQLEQKLSDEGYNYNIINGGVSGDTSAGLLSRAELYLDQNPDLVILVIGGNDGLRGLSTDTLEENILSIADIFLKQDIPVVLGGMDIPINLGLNYRKKFREVYESVTKQRDNIYRMEYFLEDVGGVAKYNQSDRIHPTAEGYEIIVENLFAFLKDKQLISKP
ncbi:arylesterase [Candidatus Gracilibacteria bacterium]|nr:arylesterase [Candidatus Gracilibacteria bacterium]